MFIAVTNQLTIANIAEFKKYINTQMQSEDEIVFDLGALEAIDVTGLQVLLSLLGQSSDLPAKFSLVNSNEVFAGAVAGFGLEQHFSQNRS